MPDKNTKKPSRGRPPRYDDPVKRTIQMERADWDFAWEYGGRNGCLGIQRALQEARERKTEE